MSKPLRIQYPDAWYHVMNRGRRGDVTPYTTNYLTRRLKGDTLKEAGEVFGISKNSTVSSCIDGVKQEMNRNKGMSVRVENIFQILNNSHP